MSTTFNDQEKESRAVAVFTQLIADNHGAIAPIAHWGDGKCGYLLTLLQQEFNDQCALIEPKKSGKAKISHTLARSVYERNAYRCVVCGGHIDLTCDHVIPESKGGETTYENLQTMCRPCNSRKGNSA